MLDVTIVVLLLSVTAHVHGQNTQTATACFGVANCNFYELKCGNDHTIRIVSAYYGFKAVGCRTERNKCRRARDGCCVYSTEDCTEPFSALHLYNLYSACSLKQSCGPLQATNNVLASCEETSTYVHITYECVPDTTQLPFCSGENKSGTEVNLIFDGSTDTYKNRENCNCFAFLSGGSLTVIAEDLRMFKKDTTNSGSDCSSSSLKINTTLISPCSNDANEEDNFVSKRTDTLGDPLIPLQLSDLYKNGQDDKPSLVWLTLFAPEESRMMVTCAASGSSVVSPTTAATATPQYTVSHNPTNTSADPIHDDSSNSGAVVAGVLVPLFLLGIAGAVVGFIIWKRRRKSLKGGGNVQQNAYTDDVSVGQDNEIYAEIGDVGDTPEPPIYDPVYESRDQPIYDPVYEPGTVNRTNSNGHTQNNDPRLSNVSDVQVPIKSHTKMSKNPLRMISSRTDRLFAWFRNQGEPSKPAGSDRGREQSQCSYDHINDTAPVIVRVTGTEDADGNPYSHARPSVDNPVQKSPKGGRISRDMSAVNLGDAYIGFTFDTIDYNDPRLLKAPTTECQSARKPTPPTRPVPSPSGSPHVRPRPSDPLTTRPKSPAFLSPVQESDTDQPAYTYVESQQNSRRGSINSNSDISDHSYKILEKQPEYDYAAPVEGEFIYDAPAEGEDEKPSLYEDVNENSNSENISGDKQEYDLDYEVPFQHKSDNQVDAFEKSKSNSPSREIAIINDSKEDTQKTKPSNTPHGYVNVGKKKKNIKKYPTGVSPEIKLNGEANEISTSGVVKSDNIKSKDYEKTDELKGVRNMAMLFESKA